MADDPCQTFTADPSSDSTESTVGRMGGQLSFAACAQSSGFILESGPWGPPTITVMLSQAGRVQNEVRSKHWP